MALTASLTQPRRASPFDHAYAVILAGGSGTRFWPLSRRKRPKQLLNLFGARTLLEETAARIRDLIPPERTYVFTNHRIRDEVRRQLRAVPGRQIVAEPASRNTAPTIGLAAHEILRHDPEGIMVVLPSDHVITKPAIFHRALAAGCNWAREPGRSVLIGLKPTCPETGYGYIRLGKLASGPRSLGIFQVLQFTEKPDSATARRYVRAGNYLWNGGMFIWRASTLIANLERLQPDLAAGLCRLAEAGGIRPEAALKRLYPRLANISIDYAVMEKAPDVFAVAADIGWSDVGSWAAAYELIGKDGAGNVRPPAAFLLDSRGNLIVSKGKFVAAVGVEDLVIVETEDALLVCARDHSQDVGKIVRELEEKGSEKLL